MAQKKLGAGKITISRWTSNKEPCHGVRITVEDATSKVEFLEVSLTMEQFALAVTGIGCVPCAIDLRGIENVGKQRETKTEQVFIPDHDLSERDKIAVAAVMKHEVDGWRARREDATNHHNYAGRVEGGTLQRVHFSRFVTAK